MAENIILDVIEKTVKKFSSFEDSYEIQKILQKEQNKENVFGFWSPFDGVGRTTAIVNIAYELAKNKSTVCIVDLNLLTPDVFRYLKPDFEINKNETVKSIREKVLNPTLPVTEFITKTKYPNISLLTPLFTEHPSVYCSQESLTQTQEKREMDVYINIFKELGEIYDFVLLDLSTNIIDSTTIAAFRSCDNIITFIGHYPKSVEYTMKTIKIFNELGLFGVFDNVVQGPVYLEAWMETELRTFNPNLNLISTIPHSNEVNASGNNLEIFTAFNKSANKAAVTYRNCITKIASILKELAKESAEKNEKARQDAMENTKIMLEGINDYIIDGDLDADDYEILANDTALAELVEAVEDDESYEIDKLEGLFLDLDSDCFIEDGQVIESELISETEAQIEDISYIESKEEYVE